MPDNEDNRSDMFIRDVRQVGSELDATGKDVHRGNLIDLFLRETEADKYVIDHMYGKTPSNLDNDEVLEKWGDFDEKFES